MPLFCGCQIGYLAKSAYGQMELYRARVPIDEALKSDKLKPEEKRKLLLAEEARRFAESDLGLRVTDNYTTFVQLNRPYVTYVVSAAEKHEMKPYLFWYPLLGSLPYKGFFDQKGAKEEAERLKAKGYDVYVRGVSAYSTLGWFKDSVLSSMLQYKDYDLVDTIIHETVHTTIYIKSEADFNERMAVFFGGKGAEAFYRKREGPDGKTLKEMTNDHQDEQLFSQFMSREIESLSKWYEERKKLEASGQVKPGDFDHDRAERIKEIQERFRAEVRPRLLSLDSYRSFETSEINNARLLTYRTYFENLDDFEVVFKKFGGDFHKMLAFCKTLEKSKDPKADLAKAGNG